MMASTVFPGGSGEGETIHLSNRQLPYGMLHHIYDRHILLQLQYSYPHGFWILFMHCTHSNSYVHRIHCHHVVHPVVPHGARREGEVEYLFPIHYHLHTVTLIRPIHISNSSRKQCRGSHQLINNWDLFYVVTVDLVLAQGSRRTADEIHG